ncbi:MAG: AmmeMemoRadiSam system protein B [Spirochaetales bacterium]|uniref:AmmeMemoRadiSam system protein B n=1 Tax=Candidatus Thalassospirochaeta sargassi TaxID=3119039 RepID=A0AAJ1MJH6_9SPIO|nr:AmmeMemoRadiSam system protein B [Spirochaetales bacterium]
MIRPRILPGGWYPDTISEIKTNLDRWTKDVEEDTTCFAAIVPHAGWYYSGRIAAIPLKKTCGGKKIIVVIGGHLPPGSSILAASESEIETPLGIIVNRLDCIKRLQEDINIEEDIFSDNTVEVILPMIKYFSPGADAIWLRAPADEKAVELGKILYELTVELEVETAVIGSTDLTHYGANYGFEPQGRGVSGLNWMKNKNDAEVIDLLVNMSSKDAVDHALANKSACSIGAAAAAVEFASQNGVEKGLLTQYSTSYDVMPSDSFVGYAGIIY